MTDPREFLRSLFDTAVASALPENCLGPWIPPRPDGRIVVVGAGKSGAGMAAELERHWEDLEGLVIVPYGHAVECRDIRIVEAAHPVPDEAGLNAARDVLQAVSDLSAVDTVVCLISGGGSSLMCLPIEGVTLSEKQAINKQLLKSGAPIHEINCVRKKLSAIKGGKLAAAAAPANVLTLVISDVPGNDPSMVASGPTIADTSAVSDALAILERYGIESSTAVRDVISNSTTPSIPDTDVRVLATSDDALIAASKLAMDVEVTPYSLGDLAGDARSIAEEHAVLAKQIAEGNGPVEAPCVIISGGETTVEVRGDGRGGRNGEYALSLALALNGLANVHAIACDTDGIDGAGDNAGCMVSPDSLPRARKAGLDPVATLENNDSYVLFEAIDDLVITGPTRTNVNDFRAILVLD